MRNKKIGRRGLNPIFLFFFCQYTVQMIDGGGGGNPKRTLKLWYFYEILNVKHNM